ncbi:MAG: c-type cytochrome [Flavobacterium sp.]|nr:c-type cytochrome [Flavobacterium sp.]
MRKIYLLSLVILIFSCKNKEVKSIDIVAKKQNPIELGKEIFEGKGNCIACHLVNQNVIGPSIKEISAIYKSQNGNIVDFLVHDAKPLVDPDQYEVMQTNFSITKAMSDEELKAIETYIYSN